MPQFVRVTHHPYLLDLSILDVEGHGRDGLALHSCNQARVTIDMGKLHLQNSQKWRQEKTTPHQHSDGER